jgi:four helix bundle protein
MRTFDDIYALDQHRKTKKNRCPDGSKGEGVFDIMQGAAVCIMVRKAGKDGGRRAMKYERFEQLPVWQAAMTLAEKVYALTDRRSFDRVRELRDQFRRAALSVSNNIAEGFERGTTAELLSFLYTARGSAGEVRSMLLFCDRLPGLQSEISDLKSQISDLKSLAESCSRQIRAWADQLQNSDIQGQRRLTERSRQAWQADRRADAFFRKLQDIRDAAASKAGPRESAEPQCRPEDLS